MIICTSESFLAVGNDEQKTQPSCVAAACL